jgi:hypothetical protein
MLQAFMENAKAGISRLRDAYKEQNLRVITEPVHRIIPSF